MFIHGSPITANFPQDLGLKDRFWYWRGASGQKYIHSIYPTGNCPPLPGAIYVAVKCVGNMRTAVAVGRFPPFQSCAISETGQIPFSELGATEIHVHLLAKNREMVDDILQDLRSAFETDKPERGYLPGLHEDSRNEAPAFAF